MTFQPEKAIAAIGYLIDKTGEGLYPLMKMMYLADRLHLWRYGRLIAGDTYSAMEKGPVPSGTYDLLKHVRGETKAMPGAELAVQAFAYGDGHAIKLRQPPDVDELSESDVDCLAEIVSLLKTHGSASIRDMSHDAAWMETRKGVLGIRRTRPMSLEAIAAQADNGAALVAHLRDPMPGSA